MEGASLGLLREFVMTAPVVLWYQFAGTSVLLFRRSGGRYA